ncbi:hypothetical protein ACI2K6_16285 [Microbacterium sp. NPDC006705]|jgi:hypothetical protein|uniref:hypothetical protein n=1 Tax=Microbacterium TaxID=33882 RepID=UPI0022AEA209|nr:MULTISPECIES: hypothetical protein [Microbacterium]MCZ4069083.1 hypothetical protein [Microbacterium sp. H37-C3]WHE37871.1 hypothetical protein P6897_16255 [Microbacterium sp. BDGP8]WRK17162.1 hypothetical protein VC184_14840 [Microbacterium plantarum]
MQNPLDGIIPDFTIFGAQFTELWQKILAGVWAIAIVISIVFLIQAIVKVGQNGESNPAAVAEGKKQVLWASISLGVLVALAVVVGAIIAIFA